MSVNSNLQQSTQNVPFDGFLTNRLVARITLQGDLVLQDSDGKTLNAEATLSQLKANRRLSREIAIVWVPTQKVIMTDVLVPGKRKAHWMAALPYALEEALSDAVENYHFVAFNRSADDQVSVAVVNHDDMRNWQLLVESYGLKHVQLVPDCFRIPAVVSENELQVAWGVQNEQDQVLARTGINQGFAAQSAWYPAIKQQFLTGMQGRAVDEQSVPELLSSSQQNLAQVMKLSLSQGSYKAAGSGGGSWYQWRWVAIMAGLVFGLLLAMQIVATQQLKQQSQYTQKQSEALFKKMFPETKRIVNIKSQTITKLRQTSGEQQELVKVVPMLQIIEPWFNQVKAVKVTELRWNQASQNEPLMLSVSAAKSTDLQRIIELSKQKQGADLSSVQLSLKLNNVTSELAEGVIYVRAN